MPRLWPLAVVAAVGMLLAAAGVLPRWPGLVHLVALPPLDLYGDLRMLLARSTSVPGFVAVLLLVLAVRIAVLALLLGGLTAARLRIAAAFYCCATPPLLVIAAVDFGAYAVLFSRTFWFALIALAVVFVVLAPVPWQRACQRRGLANYLRPEVLVPYAAALVAIGALADLGGGWVAVTLLPVSALATAGAVIALTRPAPQRVLPRLSAAAVAVVVAATALVLTRSGEPGPPASPRAGSLLLMSGIDSASGSGSIFETDVSRLGYECDQVYYFSYAGTGDGAPQQDATCPIRTGAPYVPADTLRPFAEQVDLFAAQVRELPRPLVVAGHSLAAWVAWHAVATGQAPQVDVIILVGPFPDSPVGYPPPGQDGPGRVAGELLRAMAVGARWGGFHFEPDAPAARQLLATPNAAAAIFAEPLPSGVRSLSLPGAADLVLMPGGWQLPVDRNGCPIRAAHGDLPEAPALYREINRFLDREPAPACPRWRDWGAPLARPFGTPPTGQ